MSANSRVMLMGSCFTDNIGEKMQEAGMSVLVNPAGAMYNPSSISALLRASMSMEMPAEAIFKYEGRTRSWLLPTRYSDTDATEATICFANTLRVINEGVMESDVLIFTFGTALVYEHTTSDISQYEGIVGNCHKVAAREFCPRRLSVNEIVADWSALVREIRDFRISNGVTKKFDLIFTVSPIRHFKDGAHENTLSKSTLHLVIDELLSRWRKESHRAECDENISGCVEISAVYFPAYELVIDDLRDYRFYAEDMLHPSPVAVDYIWEHFKSAYFTEKDCMTLAQRAREERKKHHRPLL